MNPATVATATRVGLRIKQARKQAGLSHDSLAMAIRLQKRNPRIRATRQHLIKLEKGTHLARPEMLQAIAEATGKTVEYLTADSDDDDEVPADMATALMLNLRRFARMEARTELAELLARRDKDSA